MVNIFVFQFATLSTQNETGLAKCRSRWENLDRFHFALKKWQTEIQKWSPSFFLFFSIIYGSAEKPDDKKKK